MNYYNPMYGQYPYNQYGGMGGGGQQMPPGQSGGAIPGVPGVPGATGVPGQDGQLPVEQSYIENILRLNKGKVATVYMTFENNQKWNAKVFKGVVEAAGRDHIILSDPQTGRRYILLMVYVDYITFDEEIEYSYPLGQMSTYSPR
jgi:spore germination protein Q